MNEPANKLIALVEDNADNLYLLRILLQDYYRLCEYGNGQLALEGIISNPPDLVLMDISLPVMDGVETLQRIRDHGLSSLPIIAFTAHAMTGDRERFLAAGFDYYISKPVLGRDQLIKPIERLLAKA